MPQLHEKIRRNAKVLVLPKCQHNIMVLEETQDEKMQYRCVHCGDIVIKL